MLFTFHSAFLLALAAQTTTASWFDLSPRHEGERHDPQGTGHGQNMSHGAFNFTPSGIVWPMCARHCCNAFFQYFPHPVNNPLCVSKPFYTNATQCIAKNCTDYEQGAFAAVAEIECPAGKQGSLTAQSVRADLSTAGGKPQECCRVNNATIECNNGTRTGGETALGSSAWVRSSVLLAVLFGVAM
ncbi:hypothetical protein B0J11DRAFT_511314 [Dendryphion nanum]|uniref:Extracellular membrane protein CFEM domain-containing protein n=1 Tax=Dendryphion nanum TaxID=256645 RepID=A0A9P9D7H4_9PLEO|nr:hypothetical protein B0J11DRAFT_511314 [Dendryphion nanum]